MRPLRVAILLLLILGSVPLSNAKADPPFDIRYSDCAHVATGCTSGTGIPNASSPIANGFGVIVRTLGGAPVANTTVSLRFNATNVVLGTQQTAGTTVNCTLKRVSKLTDVFGKVLFTPRIGGFDNASSITPSLDDLGAFFPDVPGRSTDIDGDGVTNSSDLNTFRTKLLDGVFQAENDLNADGVENASDLAIMNSEIGVGASLTFCP